MKTNAIISPAQGEVAFQEQELKALEKDEVLVQCKASIISPGTERAFILNLPGVNAQYPLHGMGYASSGVVVQAGKDAQIAVGTRVATKMSHRSYGVIKSKLAIPLPGNVSFAQAAFGTLGSICLQGLRKARIEIGEPVLIIGLGLIGQIEAMLARLAGAYPVIVADIIPEKIERALAYGADIGINTKDAGWIDTLKEKLGGKLPAVVIESTGYPKPISDAFDAAERMGRVILLGSTRGESTVDFYRQVHKKGLQVIGAHISTIPPDTSYPGHWTVHDNITCFVNLLGAGRIDVQQLIDEKVSCGQCIDAFYKMLKADQKTLATLIEW